MFCTQPNSAPICCHFSLAKANLEKKERSKWGKWGAMKYPRRCTSMEERKSTGRSVSERARSLGVDGTYCPGDFLRGAHKGFVFLVKRVRLSHPLRILFRRTIRTLTEDIGRDAPYCYRWRIFRYMGKFPGIPNCSRIVYFA